MNPIQSEVTIGLHIIHKPSNWTNIHQRKTNRYFYEFNLIKRRCTKTTGKLKSLCIERKPKAAKNKKWRINRLRSFSTGKNGFRNRTHWVQLRLMLSKSMAEISSAEWRKSAEIVQKHEVGEYVYDEQKMAGARSSSNWEPLHEFLASGYWIGDQVEKKKRCFSSPW